MKLNSKFSVNFKDAISHDDDDDDDSSSSSSSSSYYYYYYYYYYYCYYTEQIYVEDPVFNNKLLLVSKFSFPCTCILCCELQLYCTLVYNDVTGFCC